MMAILTFVAAVLLVLAGVSQAQNSYCRITTCRVPGTENTLCKFSNTSWGAACQPAYPTKSTISAAEITIILNVHNSYRRQVAKGLEARGAPGPQPPASNMRQLKWDNELAVMAQTHAQQCVYKHDSCRNVARFVVGQNNYISGSSIDNLATSDWKTAIKAWYNEVLYMKSAYVRNFPLRPNPPIPNPPGAIGHYTQVVWANTYTVGCGVAYYKSTALFGPKLPYNKFYVCNYGPAGNFINGPVYAQGSAGSTCPAGTKNNDGLCA